MKARMSSWYLEHLLWNYFLGHLSAYHLFQCCYLNDTDTSLTSPFQFLKLVERYFPADYCQSSYLSSCQFQSLYCKASCPWWSLFISSDSMPLQDGFCMISHLHGASVVSTDHCISTPFSFLVCPHSISSYFHLCPNLHPLLGLCQPCPFPLLSLFMMFAHPLPGKFSFWLLTTQIPPPLRHSRLF